MILVFAGLLALMVFGGRICFHGTYEGYLSRNTTLSIKGIFVLLVFFSHFRQYADLSAGWYDAWYGILLSWIGQLMVVMFLFYSGYGILIQIHANRDRYISAFLRRRLFPVWLQFALCILIYLAVDLAMGLLQSYSWLQIGLAFTGWTSVGNSSWFMFVTFALYLIVFASFRLLKNSDIRLALVLVTLLAGVLTVVLYYTKESYWWNTLLCFPLGMWFGFYKERIDRIMQKPWYWLIAIWTIAACVTLWAVQVKIRPLGKGYPLLAMLFALSVVFLTMKIKIGNSVLCFFGRHVFSIYMLQRIPMIVFKGIIKNEYIYFVICFTITILLAIGFDYLFLKCFKQRIRVQLENH